ncbi:restriction endonuclease subunit S [Deinococcus gobiensis]|uniref:Restriction endonuclease S subunit n=1 Tax=Deinococcus gobiensis (strain DSM 21396 / JCM 16679 / CGMCC 1.7299 / I-0) TaxID=745776 RepID=H8GUM2_DEIGI|nr:restriction endonuclease subunit S [Deinococcus gobiensis]AFD26705.1 Restriction endonuclease S subunit [Deinococcus gobiensis I-0]
MLHDLRPYPAMKDSGVPWLGLVPEHWDVRRLKYLLREQDARSVNGNEQLLRVSQYTGVTERRRADGGDEPDTRAASLVGYKKVAPQELVVNIMLAWNGSMGVSQFAGITSPAYCVYDFRQEANPWYFHHLLRSPTYKARIRAVSTGVVESRLRLYTDDLYRLEALLPPLPEQAAIVRFLDHADRRIRKAIAAKQRLIRLLQEQKQVIIHQAVTRGLDPNVKLKPSGVEWLGDVPEGWSILKIGYFAKVGNGSTPSRGNALYWTDGSYPWLNSSIVNHGKVTVANQFITHQALQECHLPIVPPGSVLVAITGQGKTRGKAATLDIEATINQHIAYITPRPNSGVTAEYLQSFLSAAYGELRRLSDDSGSTKGALTCDALKNFKIAVPPVLEQTQLLQHIREASASADFAITHAQREISLLREYRTRLIADVVTGKLNVRAAAARLPEQEPDAMPEELEGGEAGDSELEADEREAELVEA